MEPYPGGPEPTPSRYRPTSSQYVLGVVVLAIAVAFFVKQVLEDTEKAQTAAFYVGIPAIVALIVVLTKPGGSAEGLVFRTITVVLSLAMIAAGEGFICVILAAPIFYLVGAVVAYAAGKASRPDKRNDGLKIIIVPSLVLVASLEGVLPATTFSSATTVTATRTVEASADEVEAAWEAPLDFGGTPLEGILGWGFPQPLADSGGTFAVGERRTVTFSGAHHRPLFVSEHHWGEHTTELAFEVVARSENSVRLKVVNDTTPISSWLAWSVADIEWIPVDAGHTDVRVELSYTRELAPAWYFGPIEKFVTERAAGYLIDSLAVSR
nr:hypothetical protein [Rhodococcus sp. (in: high G+C Gram-positive bacteria)]